MLSNNQFVRVFALDFSKAFDSIKHEPLLGKLSSLSIPDEIYNWIEHFFQDVDTVPDSGMIYLKSQKLPPASCRGPASVRPLMLSLRPT